MPALVPSRIGRYEIVKELGRGTMGVVYEARDPVLERRVALKTIHLPHVATEQRREIFERRFLAEAQAAGQLSHTGIVVVHDVGRDSETGLLYIALEFLVGRTLAELLEQDALPEWRERLRILARVARALHHAHTRGVVHRDIKPANIMILPSGEPKVMDFGIAKLDTSDLTSPGEIFGTPLYMAPEQALGEKVDARSDLFSLGSIAYVLLTGRPPFTASNVPSILARVAHQDPPRPTEIVPDLPEDTDYLIARAMAKSPDRRYPNGQRMAEDFEDVAAGQPPRHRKGWQMPDQGAGTVFMQPRALGAPEVALDLHPLTPAKDGLRKRIGRVALRLYRRIGAARLLAATLAATAVYLYLNPHLAAYWNGWLCKRVAPLIFQDAADETRSRGSASKPTPTPAPAREENEGELEDVALPPGAETDENEPAVDLVEEAEPSPPVVSSPPASSVSSAGATPRPSPAKLQIVFEHSLRGGKLRVWIDSRLVLSETLDSRVQRKFLVFSSRKGVVVETLKLKPGRHVITVQVSWNGNVRTAGIRTTLGPNSRRCLEAAEHRGKLILRWRY